MSFFLRTVSSVIGVTMTGWPDLSLGVMDCPNPIILHVSPFLRCSAEIWFSFPS